MYMEEHKKDSMCSKLAFCATISFLNILMFLYANDNCCYHKKSAYPLIGSMGRCMRYPRIFLSYHGFQGWSNILPTV